MSRYAYEPFEYVKAAELDPARQVPDRYPVVIVGAGPIGLAMAIDLALHEIPSVVIDDNDVVSVGSRAICWSKRTLEIFDRLGVGDRMLEKGVTWKVGRLFHGEQEVYSFDLLPEEGHKMPAFINLQQYYVEEYLVDRCKEFSDLIDLRFKNKAVRLERDEDEVRIEVATPDGNYLLKTEYLLACDGANSQIRQMMGLELEGRLFEERFLICDVEMEADFPSERWFWFEPDFHPGQSALLHKQPDNIYRIDFQLGWDADPEVEKLPENVIPRVEKALGGRPFEIDWVSVYTFRCARLDRFLHDRVVFVGDSAHVVSPFGARGGNGGIQDVDNLGWKLAAVLKQNAPASLLESYNTERTHGSDENILNSTRATNFMSPRSEIETLFRDECLALASHYPFARRLINSGRLSVPCSLAGFELETPGTPGPLEPGSVAPDAPVKLDGKDDWLLNRIGNKFTLVSFGDVPVEGQLELQHLTVKAGGDLEPSDSSASVRYGEGLAYLIRPDQHVAAVFESIDPAKVHAARDKAMGLS